MAYDEDEPVFRAAPAVARRVTRQGSRYYAWRGEQYHSVTTILGALGKAEGLVYWSANGVARWVVDNFDILSLSMQKDEHGVPREDPEIVYNRLKKVPWEVRDRAGDVGSAVHAAIEAYGIGKPMPPWPPITRPRMEAFEQFLRDYRPRFEASEINVYSKRWRYAGTCDGIVVLPEASSALLGFDRPRELRVLFDVKTGKSVYEDPALQMAAYRHADVFLAAPDGSEHPMPKVDTCAVLHLPADGTYSLIEMRADDDVYRAFLHVREVFRWKQGLAKKVVLPPIRSLAPKGEPDAERREVAECKHFGVSGFVAVAALTDCGCSRCVREMTVLETTAAEVLTVEPTGSGDEDTPGARDADAAPEEPALGLGDPGEQGSVPGLSLPPEPTPSLFDEQVPSGVKVRKE